MPTDDASAAVAFDVGMSGPSSRGSSDTRSEEEKRREVAQRLDAVSARERQVLDGVVEGKPNKIIAFDLGISARTVEIYRANVMTKMEAGSLSELVKMAMLAG